MADKTIIHTFPDGARIVLESAEGATAYLFQNLYCIRGDGSKIWEAQLPGFPDAISAARMDENVLYANTMSGYLLHLNANTGQETNRWFTK